MKLKKYIKSFRGECVQAGFLGGELYPSDRNTEGWTYAELMAFHELEVKFTHKRQVFKQASVRHGEEISKKAVERFRKGMISSVRGNLKRPENVLNPLGKLMKMKIRGTFGKTSSLIPKNTRNTINRKGHSLPMIEDGVLRSGLSYRNSINNEIIGGGS